MEPPHAPRVFSVSEVIIEAEESLPCTDTTPSTSDPSTTGQSGIIACFTYCPKDGLVPVAVKKSQQDAILISTNKAANVKNDCANFLIEQCTMDSQNCDSNQFQPVERIEIDRLKKATINNDHGDYEGNAAELCEPTLMDCDQYENLIDVNANTARQHSTRKRNRQPTQKMSEFICRICEQQSFKLIKIFGSQGSQLKLADKIHFHLPIQVKADDKLPLGVCACCVNSLNVCNDLYQKSLNTDSHLRKVFRSESQTKPQASADLLGSKKKNQIIANIQEAINAQESKVNQNSATIASTKVLDSENGIQPEDNLDTGIEGSAEADDFEDEVAQEDDEKEKETCYLCQETFPSHRELLKHRKTHPPEERLKCQDCGKTMPNDQSLASHQKIHSGNTYQCHICGKVLASSNGLRTHQLVHEDPKFCCQVCGRTFRTTYKLQGHMVMHSEKRPFSCSVCGQMFKTKVTLKQHLLIHAEKRMFICDICGHSVNRLSHLRLHMNSHRHGNHSTNWTHPCSQCTLQFRHVTGLARHLVAVHGATPPPPPPPTSEECLLCTECGNQYQTRKDFVRHKIICRKIFQCEVCSRILTSRRSLENHTRGHTGEKPFPCSFCGQPFKSVVSKEIHERVHTGERPFKCIRCDKAFRSMTNLYQHKATHDAPRKYSCNYCSYKTHRPAGLKIHLRSHSGEKPYSCTVCGKSYKASWDLKLHSEIHTFTGTRHRRIRQKHKPNHKSQEAVLAVVSESGDVSLNEAAILLNTEDL